MHIDSSFLAILKSPVCYLPCCLQIFILSLLFKQFSFDININKCETNFFFLFLPFETLWMSAAWICDLIKIQQKFLLPLTLNILFDWFFGKVDRLDSWFFILIITLFRVKLRQKKERKKSIRAEKIIYL